MKLLPTWGKETKKGRIRLGKAFPFFILYMWRCNDFFRYDIVKTERKVCLLAVSEKGRMSRLDRVNHSLVPEGESIGNI